MNHIKKFNESIDELCYLIKGYNELINYVHNHSYDKFNRRDLNIIESLKEHFKLDTITKLSSYVYVISTDGVEKFPFDKKTNHIYKQIVVRKYQDEYFMLEIISNSENLIYIVDSIDGFQKIKEKIL